MTKLEKHLKEKGKTDSWLNLAQQFNFEPELSKDSRVKKIKKLYTTIESKKPVPYLTGNENNVLIIGDIHEPFTLDGYLEFCVEQQKIFNCGKIIFIGDIIDSHFSSFHHSDPDGMSAGLELSEAIKKLEKWHYYFPNAIVCLGNHDRIWSRKLYASGISARLLKPFNDVLNTPTWSFVEQHIYNDVLYIHGENGSADKKVQSEFISVVQGHHHTEAYVKLFAGTNKQLFAMQVGTGIDFNSYAFGYAQRGKKPIISCGVIIGNTPILIPYQ